MAVASPGPLLGQLREFDQQKENITVYFERVALYFETNSIPEEKKVPLLLTVIGAETYGTLRSLFAPSAPREKTFEELQEALQKHFDPKPLVIGQRFQFYRRFQRPNESLAEFLTDA
jgi:hypothetical protein